MQVGKTRLTPVICVRNEGYSASLEVGKVYPMLEPEEGDDLLSAVRVVDESGEDYLFPKEFFEPVEISEAALAALWDELQS